MTDERVKVVEAALWMGGTIVSLSLLAIAGRAASPALDTFEIMLYRSVIAVVLVIVCAWLWGSVHTITRRHMKVHVGRNAAHFAAQNLWLFALTVAPIAQVFALEFTTPVWVVLLAPMVLAEALTRDRLLVVAIGFAGVLVVARPWSETIGPGVSTAALSAIGFAVAALYTRKLVRTETITCILFWLSVLQLAFGLVCAGYDGDIALPSVAVLPWLAIIATSGLVAHFCLTRALSVATASVVMPFDFLRLPVIICVGVWIYGEPLDPFVLIGGGIIFCASYINILAVRARQRQRGSGLPESGPP